MTKEEILNCFYPSGLDKPYNKNISRDSNKSHIVDELIAATPDSNDRFVTISERLFCLKNDLETIPSCSNTLCINSALFKNQKHGYGSFCSAKCAATSSQTKEKRKRTCDTKFGGQGFASTEISRSVRTKCLELYGVEYALQSDEIKDKFKATIKLTDKDSIITKRKTTNIKKYGFEFHQQHPEQILKIKKSIIESHGGIGFGSETIKDSISATNLSKYGTIYPMQVETVRNKFKQTMLSKYGYDNPTKCKEILERRRSNILAKTGYTMNSQSHISQETLNILHNSELFQSYLAKSYNAIELADSLGVSISTILIYIEKYNIRYKSKISKRSRYERELESYLNALPGIVVVTGNRTILDGREIDILIGNIGIEFNGEYWHSEKKLKDKNYHLKKTERCSEKGIQLIHVFESEWVKKKEIVKSIISSKLGIFENRIYARNCKIDIVDNNNKNKFLEENHIQGKDNSSVKLGLFYNGELISIMTFGHSRYNQNYQYEMHRFCSKIGYQIVGGASKLWKYFLNNYNPESVITYADRRYSNGEFYEKIGFERIGISKPNYFYFNSGYRLISRVAFQKHKLKTMLPTFDESKTEWENMQMNGYDRIWDCGNFKFGWLNSHTIEMIDKED